MTDIERLRSKENGMTDIERLQPDGVAQPYAHYSTVSRVGDRVYVAGLVALDAQGALVGRGDAHAQALHVCRMLERIAQSFGVGLDRVVQCQLFVTDRANYRTVDAAYAEVFGDNKPSRATVVCDLTDPELLVELVGWLEL